MVSGVLVSRTKSCHVVVGPSVAADGTPSVVTFHQQRLPWFVGAMQLCTTRPCHSRSKL
jgi:hypothetical protein